jgi:hypothetical protein
MNPETLERLMLDDSLGALADDIRALLIERIAAAGSPAAARFAAYQRTVEAARAALAQPERAALPPFPATRLRREAASLRRQRLAGRIAALAASLVLGLGLGYLAFSRAEATAPAPAPVAVAQVAAPDAAPAPEAVTEFWSSRRLAARAMAAQSQTPVKVTWISPVQQPRIGG